MTAAAAIRFNMTFIWRVGVSRTTPICLLLCNFKRDFNSDGTGSVGDPVAAIEAKCTAAEVDKTNGQGAESQPQELPPEANANSDDGPNEVPNTPVEAANADGSNSENKTISEDALKRDEIEGSGEADDARDRDAQSGEEGTENEDMQLSEEHRASLVATDITFVRFREGEKVREELRQLTTQCSGTYAIASSTTSLVCLGTATCECSSTEVKLVPVQHSAYCSSQAAIHVSTLPFAFRRLTIEPLWLCEELNRWNPQRALSFYPKTWPTLRC